MSSSITVGADRAQGDPMAGFTGPRDFLGAVQTAAQGVIDDRLRPLAVAGSDEQSAASDPYGGFLLPSAMQPRTALSVGLDEDPSADRVRPVPMRQHVEHVVARVDKDHTTSVTGGVRLFREQETDPITATRGEMERIELRSLWMHGLTFGGGRLVMDSGEIFRAFLLENFRTAKAAKQLEERIHGTGVGEFLGVLQAGCTIDVAADAGQAAQTVTASNLLAMRRRAWGYRRAVWIAHPEYAEGIPTLTTTIGTSGAIVPLWHPGTAEEEHPDWLLGRPLYYSDYSADLGARGDVILACWSEYLDGRRVNQGRPDNPADKLVESIHVRFASGESAFRFWTAGDGQPWWRSALTPRNSATTRSPFVTLAARAA